jgi:hypothetical protein
MPGHNSIMARKNNGPDSAPTQTNQNRIRLFRSLTLS